MQNTKKNDSNGCRCYGLGTIPVMVGCDVIVTDCPDCPKIPSGLVTAERDARLHPHHRNEVE